jgi:glutaminase
MAIAMAGGETVCAGDASNDFSIQSISKVFSLTLALSRLGDNLWQRVGREPSGSAFNSIVQLEHEHGVPRNPFINAGAIVCTDVVLEGQAPTAAIAEILDFVRLLSGSPSIQIDPAIARSEASTGFLNAALANYMLAYGNLRNPAEDGSPTGIYRPWRRAPSACDAEGPGRFESGSSSTCS